MPYQFVSADDFLRLAHLFYLFQTETVCFRQKDSQFPAISQISADFHGKVGLFLCPNHLPGEPFPEMKMPLCRAAEMLLFSLVHPPRQSRKNKGICNKFADLLKLRSDRCRCLLILYDSDRYFVFRLQGSDRSLQGIHAVGVLPLHAQILAAHVAVGSQLAVNGLAQVEFADDGGGGQVEHLLHSLLDLLI